MALGALNGYLVMRTRPAQFIVTLAFLFILRGLTLALSILFTDRTIISGVGDPRRTGSRLPVQGTRSGRPVPLGSATGLIETCSMASPLVPGIPKVMLWWCCRVRRLRCSLRTRFGNWIFAVGGDAVAAKNVGVPVAREDPAVRGHRLLRLPVRRAAGDASIGSAAADRGLLKEFEAIIAAVIGGTLLTGGYGSVIGACFGALIFGVVQIGISYTNVTPTGSRCSSA
jgi:simple sugar transport system permease protein